MTLLQEQIVRAMLEQVWKGRPYVPRGHEAQALDELAKEAKAVYDMLLDTGRFTRRIP